MSSKKGVGKKRVLSFVPSAENRAQKHALKIGLVRKKEMKRLEDKRDKFATTDRPTDQANQPSVSNEAEKRNISHIMRSYQKSSEGLRAALNSVW